ncbi:MAG: glycogen debranching enzyme N-terminal domain-containing protein, partial [Candidatus Micrarchaeota archaeon]|nr:glycogen debranching enzyme N-terminal domain-containing protein [Candidatus Micrarchaeota archaeon]
FLSAVSREWWLGNAVGGWASGTIAGANTRKYHGLLAAATPHPESRWLLLAKLEETALAAGQRVSLGCNFYPDSIHPDGWERIGRFSFDGAVARWTYEFAGRRLAKEVWCAHGRNATHIRYTLLEGDKTGLEIVPLVSGRGVHGLGLPESMREGKWPVTYSERRVDWDLPVAWSVSIDDGLLRPRPDIYHGFNYPVEKTRGEGFSEDLRAPGQFELLLNEGQHVTLTAAAEGIGWFEAHEPEVASHRIDRLVETMRAYNRLSGPHPALESLARAADSFIIREAGRHSIVAGYPYFGRWGRDAMIALPGLCVYTGRHPLARDIIENWMELLRAGRLPAHYNDSNEPVYEAADGFLWMLWAIGQLDDEGGFLPETLTRWWPAIDSAIRTRLAGNGSMRVDKDGLVVLKEDRMTWMDAQVDGRPVTPRPGKRVEINALWTHGLGRAAQWAVRARDADSASLFSDAAEEARGSMGKFYNDYAHYLDDGIEPTDGALRPNQLWALCLPGIGLPPMQARQALGVVRERLLLPGAGLRTLAPEDPNYHDQFAGGQGERDRAYHQGAAWPWLVGAYASATAQLFPQRMGEVAALVDQLCDPQRMGAMLGLAEVYDPSTRWPAGAPTQAWSVGEALRAGVLAERMKRQWGPARQKAEAGGQRKVR